MAEGSDDTPGSSIGTATYFLAVACLIPSDNVHTA